MMMSLIVDIYCQAVEHEWTGDVSVWVFVSQSPLSYSGMLQTQLLVLWIWPAVLPAAWQNSMHPLLGCKLYLDG